MRPSRERQKEKRKEKKRRIGTNTILVGFQILLVEIQLGFSAGIICNHANTHRSFDFYREKSQVTETDFNLLLVKLKPGRARGGGGGGGGGGG